MASYRADAQQLIGSEPPEPMDIHKGKNAPGNELGNPEAEKQAKEGHQKAAKPAELQGKALVNSLHLSMQQDFDSSSMDCSEVRYLPCRQNQEINKNALCV